MCNQGFWEHVFWMPPSIRWTINWTDSRDYSPGQLIACIFGVRISSVLLAKCIWQYSRHFPFIGRSKMFWLWRFKAISGIQVLKFCLVEKCLGMQNVLCEQPFRKKKMCVMNSFYLSVWFAMRFPYTALPLWIPLIKGRKSGVGLTLSHTSWPAQHGLRLMVLGWVLTVSCEV